MSAERPITIWDHEDDRLINEMPPEFGYGIARGRFEAANNFALQVDYVDSAFQDLASLTLGVGLAAIVAAHDASDRAIICRELLQRIATQPDLEDLRKVRSPSLGTWYRILSLHLPKLISELVSSDRRIGILARMTEVPYFGPEPEFIRIRNDLQHKLSKTANFSSQAAQEIENKSRQEIIQTIGYWWEYSLGYLDVDFIKFTKARLGKLPLSGKAGLVARSLSPLFSTAQTSNAIVPAFLIGERDGSLYDLAPFIVCERLKDPEVLFIDNAQNRSYCFNVVYRALRFTKHKKDPVAVSLQHRFTMAADRSIRLTDNLSSIANALEKQALTCRAIKLDADDYDAVTGMPERDIVRLKFILDTPEGRDILSPTVIPRRGSLESRRRIIDSSDSSGVVTVESRIDRKKLCAKILRARFSDAAARRFHAEEHILRQLKDMRVPYVVNYAGSGKVQLSHEAISSDRTAQSVWDDCEFLATEYVGLNLRNRIRANRKALLDATTRSREMAEIAVIKHIARALYMVERVTEALCTIYEKTTTKRCYPSGEHVFHFLHRDMKPENLLDADHGDIRICDFDSAFYPSDDAIKEILLESSSTSPHTAWRSVDNAHLSRQYCAPEVWSSPRSYSPNADVFSVGMVIDELLWGEARDTQSEIAIHGDEYRTGAWSLYTPPERFSDPSLRDVISCVLADVERFASTQPLKPITKLWFNLKTLVSNATAHTNNGRWTMAEVREAVRQAGRTLRAYTAQTCEQRIDMALQSKDAVSLRETLFFLGEAFGHHHKDSLALPKCEEECHKPDDQPCLVAGVGQAAAVMQELANDIVLRNGLDEEGAHASVDARRVRRVLSACRTALGTCVGLIDDPPGEIGGDTPHHRFRDATAFWRDIFLVEDAFEVESREHCETKNESLLARSVAEEILRYIVTLGRPEPSRSGSRGRSYA
jgi:serine/threonine protein kinase